MYKNAKRDSFLIPWNWKFGIKSSFHEANLPGCTAASYTSRDAKTALTCGLSACLTIRMPT